MCSLKNSDTYLEPLNIVLCIIIIEQKKNLFFLLLQQAVIQNMKVTCKCHGVSGSCSLITCWQQLAPFRKVGDHLEKRYDDATRVKTTRQGRLRVRRKVNNVPTANDLVFLHRSPNYCHANDTIGSLGKFCFYLLV